MEMVFQLLVLGFTAYVWWLARRDLTRQAAEISGPAIQEWERLQETVQTLIADLERRAMLVEQRVTAAEQRMVEAGARPLDDGRSDASPSLHTSEPDASQSEDAPYSQAQSLAHDERYAPVYALADAGVTDAAEIARRTGLGSGEIALVLGLYARQHPR